MVATWMPRVAEPNGAIDMARPKKSDAPYLADRVNLTAGAIERLACPDGKQQAFMRDSKVPGLRVRVTAGSAKSFVFEAKLNRQTIRRTIGDELRNIVAGAAGTDPIGQDESQHAGYPTNGSEGVQHGHCRRREIESCTGVNVGRDRRRLDAVP